VTGREFQSGDVVRYTPANRFDRMWCREGMAIADDRGHLVDTYWGTSMDSHVMTTAEIETAELVFNLGDYREMPYRDRGQWVEYHPDQRQMVTGQHGLTRRLFVLLDAQPDMGTRIENAREALREAEERAASAVRQVEWRRKDLAELESQR
jgi:hypothetical protein